jgi:uncharacterized protein (TIGR02265 family)
MAPVSNRSWPSGFSAPDFHIPIGSADAAVSIPEGATVKGFFFQRAQKELEQRGLPFDGTRRYTVFKDYPLAEYRDLLLLAAGKLHPQVPQREGLRRLGQLAYPTLADTMIGRVIFGVLGNDLTSVMKAAAKGYKVSMSPGSAEVLDVGARHAHVRLDDVYVFLDSYQVGVFEGAITACGRVGEVGLRRHSPITAELYCQWD